jgi:hypothetical protein
MIYTSPYLRESLLSFAREGSPQDGLEFAHAPWSKVVKNRSYVLDVKWNVVFALGNQDDWVS